MPANPPLLGLLGACWELGVRVVGAGWSGDGTVACFALADGTVALARAEWQGGPQIRPRQRGGIEVTPPAEPSPALSRLRVHDKRCLAFTADADGGFLSGGADGDLVRFDSDGKAKPLPAFSRRPVEVIASATGGWRAAASGRDVVVLGPARLTLAMPEAVTALSFDKAGQSLGVAHRAGITLCSVGSGAARQAALHGPTQVLAWRPDGAWLAVAGENGVAAVRAPGFPPRSEHDDAGPIPIAPLRQGIGGTGWPALSFSMDGTTLAASGWERTRCWRFDDEGPVDTDPLECGLRNRVSPVCAVAFHPARLLLAVGHENGAVLLCQPGVSDALFVKNWGGGAVAALAWSADGRRLALATVEGQAGLLLLPPELLRAEREQAELAG